MSNLSGESREQNRKDEVTRFPSVTCARQLRLLVNILGSHLKLVSTVIMNYKNTSYLVMFPHTSDTL